MCSRVTTAVSRLKQYFSFNLCIAPLILITYMHNLAMGVCSASGNQLLLGVKQGGRVAGTWGYGARSSKFVGGGNKPYAPSTGNQNPWGKAMPRFLQRAQFIYWETMEKLSKSCYFICVLLNPEQL